MAIAMDQPGQMISSSAATEGQNFERLLESVYDELRRIAHFHRLNERPDLTLQTTALVHEAYLRLINSRTVPEPRDERQMKALTSRVIRRVLVDHARQRNAQKRDPAHPGEALAQVDLLDPNLAVHVLDLDAALNQLAHASQRLERIVELRFFGGLTNEEVSAELDISLSTTERDWRKARLYLLELLQPSETEN